MRKRSPIGLDIGAHTIKAVQLDGRGHPSATAAIPRLRPGGDLEPGDITRLAGVLYRRGFLGSSVAIAAPKPIMHRLTLDLPPLGSGAPIGQIAGTELARQRRLEPGSFEYRWYPSPQPPRHASGSRAIAVSCTHADATALLDMIEARGLDPIALHSPADAAAYAVTRGGTLGTVGVLDLGWSDATFISVRGGEARFVRSMATCGLASIVGEEDWLAASMGGAIRSAIRTGEPCEDEEFGTIFKRYRTGLMAELNSSIGYLEGCGEDEAPSSLVVMGGGAAVPGVLESIRAETGLRTTEPPPPLAGPFAPAAALAAAPMSDPLQDDPHSSYHAPAEKEKEAA